MHIIEFKPNTNRFQFPYLPLVAAAGNCKTEITSQLTSHTRRRQGRCPTRERRRKVAVRVYGYEKATAQRGAGSGPVVSGVVWW